MDDNEIVLPVATLTVTYGYTADGETTMTTLWADPNTPGRIPDDVVRGGMLAKLVLSEDMAAVDAWEEGNR